MATSPEVKATTQVVSNDEIIGKPEKSLTGERKPTTAPGQEVTASEVARIEDAYAKFSTGANTKESAGTRSATSDRAAELPLANVSYLKTDAYEALIFPGYLAGSSQLRVTNEGGKDVIRFGTGSLTMKAQFPSAGSSDAKIFTDILNCPNFPGQSSAGFFNCWEIQQNQAGQLTAQRHHEAQVSIPGKETAKITRTSPMYFLNEKAQGVVVGGLEGTFTSGVEKVDGKRYYFGEGTIYRSPEILVGGGFVVEKTAVLPSNTPGKVGARTDEVLMVDPKGASQPVPPVDGVKFTNISAVSPLGTSVILSNDGFPARQYMFDVGPKNDLVNPREIKLSGENTVNTDDVIHRLKPEQRAQLDSEAVVTGFRVSKTPFPQLQSEPNAIAAREDKSTLTGTVSLEIKATSPNGDSGTFHLERAAEVSVEKDGKFKLIRVLSTQGSGIVSEDELGFRRINEGQVINGISQFKTTDGKEFNFNELQVGNPERRAPELGVQMKAPESEGGDRTDIGPLINGLMAISNVALDKGDTYGFRVGSTKDHIYLQIVGQQLGGAAIYKIKVAELENAAGNAGYVF